MAQGRTRTTMVQAQRMKTGPERAKKRKKEKAMVSKAYSRGRWKALEKGRKANWRNLQDLGIVTGFD